MDQADFYEKHGHRFCFYLLYNIVSFIPIAWMKYTEVEAQRQWNIIYMLLLMTGVFTPFIIEGSFMRKAITTYNNQRRTIRSFYMAPVFGLCSMFLGPIIYWFYACSQYDMFTVDNTKWVLTAFFGFLIEFSSLCYMAY